MMKNIGGKVVEGALSKLQEQSAFEWVTFQCVAKHTFAIEVKKDMLIDEYTETLSKLSCPICNNQSIRKKGTL